MRTTVTIDKEIAVRAALIGERMGLASMSKSVEFLTRKAADLIDANGYDEFIKIPSSKKEINEPE